jgi:hypothetical protein
LECEIGKKCEPIKKINKQIYYINDVTYPKLISLHSNKSIDFNCLNQSKNLKLILFWNKMWNVRDDFYFGLGREKPFLENGCPVTKCEITTNKSQINESDLVITHMLADIENPPKFRPSKQRWVYLKKFDFYF